MLKQLGTVQTGGMARCSVIPGAGFGGWRDEPLPLSATRAQRLLHVGEMTRHSGTADFLAGFVDWAERNGDDPAEIWWAGDGVLRGVLSAQPLPAHVRQRFLGRLGPDGILAAFADCEALVVLAYASDTAPVVAQALAAGLTVIGSVRSRAIRDCVRGHSAAGLFDPLRPGALPEALDRVFGRTAIAPPRAGREVAAAVL